MKELSDNQSWIGRCFEAALRVLTTFPSLQVWLRGRCLLVTNDAMGGQTPDRLEALTFRPARRIWSSWQLSFPGTWPLEGLNFGISYINSLQGKKPQRRVPSKLWAMAAPLWQLYSLWSTRLPPRFLFWKRQHLGGFENVRVFAYNSIIYNYTVFWCSLYAWPSPKAKRMGLLPHPSTHQHFPLSGFFGWYLLILKQLSLLFLLTHFDQYKNACVGEKVHSSQKVTLV